jgi:hypothetical protein
VRTICAVTIGLLALAAASWAEELPSSVTSYYDDWNFVVLNSRPAERQAIWEEFTMRDRLPDSHAGAEILQRMKRIEATTVTTGTTMPIPYPRIQPVRSELLAPDNRWAGNNDQILMDVLVMRVPDQRATSLYDPHWPFRSQEYPTDLPVMGRYTDRWQRAEAGWRLHRSPAVAVSVR